MNHIATEVRVKAIVAVLAVTMFVLVPGTATGSPTVQPLYLPSGATIDPVGDNAAMISRGNVIAATIVVGQNRASRVAVWRAGKVDILNLVTKFAQPNSWPGFETLGALTADGKVIVNGEYPFQGAYMGTGIHTFMYEGQAYQEVHFPPCALTGGAADPIVEGANKNELAVTFTPASAIINFDGDFAPNAAIITSDKCDVIGRGTILSMRGQYAAGFQGYFGMKLEPDNIERDWQHYVAVRWIDRKLEQLGEGVALGVNAQGVCVGYQTISTENQNGCSACPPSVTRRAALWRQNGLPAVLEPNLYSVAYAIDDDGRVVGMLQDAAGRHFAFLWHDGRLRRLDNLIQAPRWRFESAYGFTPDGGILGIGTHDGIATAFIAHP